MDLAAIRAKAKSFIGDSDYDNTALDVVINRMYQRVLPLEFTLEALKTEYTVSTTEGEDSYAVNPDTYLTIRKPAFLNGSPVSFWRNKADFYDTYTKERLHSITGADTTNNQFTIAGKYNSSFGVSQTFRVNGSTGNDAMWTVSAVTYTSNVTTITVTGSITDATADGTIYRQTNNTPTDVLYADHTLIFRPHPDTNYGANYRFVADAILVPTALSAVTDEPIEKLWGMLLAIDSAIDIMADTDRDDEIKNLINLREKHAALISAKELKSFLQVRSKPQF